MRTLLSTRLSLLLLPLALSGITACRDEPPAKVEAPRPVRTIVVQPQSVAGALVLPAELRPRVETRYGFRVGGKLAQRLVSVGDRVRPGQVLATLDPQDLAPALASAEAALEAARTDAALAAAELKRQVALRERNFISPAALDRQQAAFDAARARVDVAQAQRQQAVNAVAFQSLPADLDGVVVAIEAEAGQVVAAGQTVIRVARAGDIEASVNVPEKSLTMVRESARWSVGIDALGNRLLEGRVREIGPAADPASRTWPVRLSLAGNLTGLAIGMTATVSLRLPESEAILLPISSLYSLDGQTRVWVFDETSTAVRAVRVVTAGFHGESVRIASGLQPGERVVTAGANLLTEGQKVRLLNAADGAR